MTFTDRHVIVTGASTGIGLATAEMLAARGATVSLIARTRATLDAAVAGPKNAPNWCASRSPTPPGT